MNKNYLKNKSQEPLFFLFTCVKDGRNFIGRLFDSLLAQTKINFVHYIYEDGSEHPLNEMIEAYKKQASSLSKPFEVLYEQSTHNIGLNMATKHCIEKCTLPYFIWIDCDNWVENTFFEELEKTALKNPKAIYIGSNRVDHYESGKSFYYLKTKNSVKSASKKNQDINFICRGFFYSFFAINNKFYKECSNNYFVNNRFFYNDNQVIAHCIFSSKNFCISKKALSHFLFRENSEGHQTDDELEKENYFFEGLHNIALHDKWKFANSLNDIYLIKKLLKKVRNSFENKNFVEARKLLLKSEAIKKKLPHRYKNFYSIEIKIWKLFCKFPWLRKKTRFLRIR